MSRDNVNRIVSMQNVGLSGYRCTKFRTATRFNLYHSASLKAPQEFSLGALIQPIRCTEKMAPMPNFASPFAYPLRTLATRNNPARHPENEIAPPLHSLYPFGIHGSLLTTPGTLKVGELLKERVRKKSLR